jgi:hypothetical protein
VPGGRALPRALIQNVARPVKDVEVLTRSNSGGFPYIGSLLELYWKPTGTLPQADWYSTASRPLLSRWLMGTLSLADGYSIAGCGLLFRWLRVGRDPGVRL